MLLDALALHEQMYVLNGELPDDADSLELRNLLLQKEYIRTLDTIPFQDTITAEMRDFLDRVLQVTCWSGDFESKLKDRYLQSITNAIRTFFGASSDGRSDDPLHTATVAALRDLHEQRSIVYAFDEKKVDALRSDVLSFLGKRLVEGFGHHPTGGSPNTSEAPLMRTFLYWRVSEHAEIALFTCPRRMGEMRLLTNQIQRRVEREVTQLLASKFQDIVESAYPNNVPLVLPPSLALFLNFYRTTRNLSTSIDQFRDLFGKTRGVFRRAEEDLSSASTIGERLKIQERLSKGLEYLKTTLEGSDDTYLEAALNYAPEVLKPLSNPMDPSKYSSGLVAKPIEWVRKWWISRPFRHVCQIVKRMLSLPKYDRLVYDTLGISIKVKEHDRLIDSYRKYLEPRGSGVDE